MSDALQIEITQTRGRIECSLAGELDSVSAPAARAALVEHLVTDQDAVIDLAGLKFIDSSGIGVLVGALKRFQAEGHNLSLRSPTPALRRVLEMTGLTTAFPIE